MVVVTCGGRGSVVAELGGRLVVARWSLGSVVAGLGVGCRSLGLACRVVALSAVCVGRWAGWSVVAGLGGRRWTGRGLLVAWARRGFSLWRCFVLVGRLLLVAGLGLGCWSLMRCHLLVAGLGAAFVLVGRLVVGRWSHIMGLVYRTHTHCTGVEQW